LSLLEQAIKYQKQNNLDDAEKIYKTLISQNKQDFNAIYLLGTIEAQKKNFEEAIVLIKESLSIYNKNFVAHNNLGLAYYNLEKFKSALLSFQEAIYLNPNYIDSYNNLGNVFLKQKKYLTAFKLYKKAFRLNNKFFISFKNIINLLIEIKKYKPAEKFLKQLQSLNIPDREIYFLQGMINSKTLRIDEAINNLLKSIEIDPNYKEAYNEIGCLYILRKDFINAEKFINLAINIDNFYFEVLYNRSWVNLIRKNFEDGWKDYSYRKNLKTFPKHKPNIKLLDNLSQIKDKKIFVYHEQGLGDSLQFCRYVKLLANKGAKVIFMVQKPLQYLLTDFDENIEITIDEKKIPQCDYYCYLLDLPMVFRTNSNNIPDEIPYIKLPNKFVGSWKYKLNSENFRIGINWSTDSKAIGLNQSIKDYRNDRSFKLEDIKDFFLLENVEFISLQKKIDEEEDKKFLKKIKIFKNIDQQHPFIDTAAIILNCDIIMTCDTSVAHLSGALGKKTLLLLPYNNDWRWGINENQSVWYSNILLYRQKKINEWQEPVFELLEYLKKRINESKKINESN
jgi:tetratricopeptide (TPR) repeat protein